jgi:3-oxoacyl-(acyl-carrier-protein) synthase
MKRVVITGLGAVTPLGNNVEEFWQNSINGVSGAGLITHFDTEKFKVHFACEVKILIQKYILIITKSKEVIFSHNMPCMPRQKLFRIPVWNLKIWILSIQE